MKKTIKWIIIVTTIIILIILYARYIGTSGLNTDEYTINESDIPSGFDGLKIVHFSDIHYDRAITIDKIDKIVDEINQINPDIVVFTGDLIDEYASLSKETYKKIAESLKKINAKYGKYAILGEDDYQDTDNVTNTLEASGFKYLDNNYDIIYSKNAEKIFIGGASSITYDKTDLTKTFSYFEDHEDIDYKIILIHEPDITSSIIKDYSVNLILAGHTHGGQIRLPLIGPIHKSEYAKKYNDSHYYLNGTNLYISSGIGVSTVSYRLWCHPSINLYRIYKETA